MGDSRVESAEPAHRVLERQIAKRLCSWFSSDGGFELNSWLSSKIEQNEDGWIPIADFTSSHARLQSLTNDEAVVAKAVRAFAKDLESAGEEEERTIYVYPDPIAFGYPADQQFAPFPGYAFVVFENPEDAKRCVDLVGGGWRDLSERVVEVVRDGVGKKGEGKKGDAEVDGEGGEAVDGDDDVDMAGEGEATDKGKSTVNGRPTVSATDEVMKDVEADGSGAHANDEEMEAARKEAAWRKRVETMRPKVMMKSLWRTLTAQYRSHQSRQFALVANPPHHSIASTTLPELTDLHALHFWITVSGTEFAQHVTTRVLRTFFGLVGEVAFVQVEEDGSGGTVEGYVRFKNRRDVERALGFFAATRGVGGGGAGERDGEGENKLAVPSEAQMIARLWRLTRVRRLRDDEERGIHEELEHRRKAALAREEEAEGRDGLETVEEAEADTTAKEVLEGKSEDRATSGTASESALESVSASAAPTPAPRPKRIPVRDRPKGAHMRFDGSDEEEEEEEDGRVEDGTGVVGEEKKEEEDVENKKGRKETAKDRRAIRRKEQRKGDKEDNGVGDENEARDRSPSSLENGDGTPGDDADGEGGVERKRDLKGKATVNDIERDGNEDATDTDKGDEEKEEFKTRSSSRGKPANTSAANSGSLKKPVASVRRKKTAPTRAPVSASKSNPVPRRMRPEIVVEIDVRPRAGVVKRKAVVAKGDGETTDQTDVRGKGGRTSSRKRFVGNTGVGERASEVSEGRRAGSRSSGKRKVAVDEEPDGGEATGKEGAKRVRRR
ncbi:hypothetical protein HDU93_007781 [Gonapodya sp. JEL0774]|nr:hypothetical protein HDU93_007781 [Gonapodya sp. JEL0774]